MEQQEMICGWEVDRRDRRPVLCGRPAKARTAVGGATGSANGLVCGVHARSAKAYGQPVTDLPGPDVRAGQVWEDADPRGYERKLRVVAVDSRHATVEQVSARAGYDDKPGRRTKIRLDRFRPTSTGYRLVADAPAEG